MEKESSNISILIMSGLFSSARMKSVKHLEFQAMKKLKISTFIDLMALEIQHSLYVKKKLVLERTMYQLATH
jgi:hypothetical protein